jgi:hypothetical protein
MLKVAAANALEYECHQKSCPKTLHHPVSKSQSEKGSINNRDGMP